MKTVREYYKYREDLIREIEKEKSEVVLEELRSELNSVENYIKQIEENELKEHENELRKSRKKHSRRP